MKKLLGVGVLGILVLGAVASGQQQPPTPPKPGPEHKALGYFIGKWTGEAKIHPGPLGPGGTMKSSDSCESFGGGFHVVCRGSGAGPMGKMTSLGVMSYNASSKAYQYYGVDSMGTAEMATGQKKGDTWTYTSTSSIAGQTFQSRYTIVETSPTTHTFKWESSPDGNKWMVLMEGKATKAGT